MHGDQDTGAVRHQDHRHLDLGESRVESGDPGRRPQLVVRERRNDAHPVESIGEQSLRVLGDVVTQAGRDDHGRSAVAVHRSTKDVLSQNDRRGPTFTSDPDLGQRFRSGVPGEADLTGLAVRRKAQLGKGLVRVTVGFADAVGSL